VTNRRESARIAVIDDEPANVALLRSLLRKLGFETVESTTDSRDAIALVSRFEPDLILLDLHMPHVDGYDVLRQLKGVIDGPAPVPVLVLTADITDDAHQRALALGARDFVSKPFRLAELALRIGNLVDARLSEQGMSRDLARLRAQVENEEKKNHPAERHRDTYRRIEATIEDRAVAMAFQPIVDLSTGRLAAVEALARFARPPIESPAVWFRQAREVGLSVHLDLAAADVALQALPDLEDGVRLALNVSEATAQSPALEDLLRRNDPRRIILELQDTHASVDLAELARRAAQLQLLGVQIAVDEFGQGSVGFERLLLFRPNYVKLDRILIEHIDVDPGRRALVAGMAAYGREIGATIVAEGIETEPELDAIRALGITLAQGFFIGRPQPLASVLTHAQ
jgi:EAL domain-containing protein (putative c-di-GMP-specific phosphodiesterase class I)/AmiR/NasT family two-component response regulator